MTSVLMFTQVLNTSNSWNPRRACIFIVEVDNSNTFMVMIGYGLQDSASKRLKALF